MYSTSSFLTKLHGPKSCNKRTQFLASYIHVTSTNDKKNGNSVSSVSKHRASHVIRHQFALNNSHRWAHYGKATWRGKTIRSIGKQTKGRKKHELHVKNECQVAKRRYAPGSMKSENAALWSAWTPPSSLSITYASCMLAPNFLRDAFLDSLESKQQRKASHVSVSVSRIYYCIGPLSIIIIIRLTKPLEKNKRPPQALRWNCNIAPFWIKWFR